MKKIIILNAVILFSIGCSNAIEQSSNTNSSAQKSDGSAIVSSHSQDRTTVSNNTTQPSQPDKKPEPMTNWTQSGNPIDTSEYDQEIAKAEKTSKAKPKDEPAKKALAESYLKRAIALTEARQYASALGDYRRVLKHDENNEEAKRWIKEIVAIYGSINRSYPNEGEEPPPLPFQKVKS
jgi:tetratricopeptide (TPR) repeat protein